MRARAPGDWLLLVLLAILWGSAFALTKVAVAGLSPELVVAGRIALAALVLGGIAWLQGLRWPRSPGQWGWFAAMALVGNLLPFSLISWGQQWVPSALAGIYMATMPLATLLLAHLLVPDERLTGARVTGVLVGLAGIVILFAPDLAQAPGARDRPIWTDLAILAGALCYATANILARLQPERRPLVAGSGVMLVAAPAALLVAAPAIDPGVASAGVPSLLAVAALGLFSTALAAVVYFRLVGSSGPSFVSLINYLIPLWALFLGAVFMGESPRATDLAALVVILAGIALTQRHPAARGAATGTADPR
jgi:drug/metabolite transporter (DMT)-like permease